MQFNQPEVLYALFLLIIPIIIHLFRLRRFKTEYFTNVKYLKKLSKQTRKSSQLKKWLVLITRLFIFSCIILAFAQPYFPNDSEIEPANTFIYLDNSYRMQAKGKQGQLFENSKQQLLKYLPVDKNIHLLTNNGVYKNVTKTDIQDIDFAPTSIDLKTILLKTAVLGKKNKKANKLLLISDLKNLNLSKIKDTSNIQLYNLNLERTNHNNVSIDTAYLSPFRSESNILNVKLSSSGKQSNSTSVSIYDQEKLLGKTGVKINEEKDTILQFQLPDKTLENGMIKIEDNGLTFDNSLFFNINKITPINVVSISNTDDLFLKKIYTQPQFNLKTYSTNSVDYNALENAQVIILNEVSEISSSLINNLEKKSKENSLLIFIPSIEMKDAHLKLLIKNLDFPEFTTQLSKERPITEIAFKNPLFKDTFEKEISNFEYPKVQNSYNINKTNNSSLLSYADRRPFLIKSKNNYIFTAPLNKSNSNFLQSPLVVLSFYNIGITVLKPSQLYYTLGASSVIDIPVSTNPDEILEMKSKNINFIPQQQQYRNSVKLNTLDLPKEPGNYEVWQQDKKVYHLSFNVDRTESNFNLIPQEIPNNIEQMESLNDFIKLSGFNQEVDSFWKWFVTFALFFLIIETLLLKYIK